MYIYYAVDVVLAKLIADYIIDSDSLKVVTSMDQYN